MTFSRREHNPAESDMALRQWFILVLLIAIAPALCPAEVAIDIGTAKQLFLDDSIIESRHQTFAVLNQPLKHEGNPVLEMHPQQQGDGKALVVVSGSVAYDQQDKLFKMWYEAADYRWRHNFVGYAFSHDGIRWELPDLNIIDYPHITTRNLVFHRGEKEIAPAVLIDSRDSNPQRRYKMLYKRGKGAGIAFSHDGLHWQPAVEHDVIAVSDSPNSVIWDARRQRYVAHTRYNHRHPDDPFHRQVLQSSSSDFLTWETEGVVMKWDEHDPLWSRQFYNMEFMPYGDVYFGFLSVYHTLPGMEVRITRGLPWIDRVDVQLTFSRDGLDWQRAGDRRVFLPNGDTPDQFDYGQVYVMQHPIVVGDEVWIYYVGLQGRHWFLHRNELQGGKVGLAKLRLDGFVSMDSGQGWMTTRTFRMSGDQLVLNADASLGAVRVELLDESGNVWPGYGRDDADPITTDAIRHTVSWRGNSDLSGFKQKPLKLRFYLDRSKLYSFTFNSTP